MMIGERDSRMRQSIGISGGNPRPIATHERRAPVNLRYSRQSATMAPPPTVGSTWSPLLLFVMLIGGESFIIVASSVLLAVLGPGGRDSQVYAQAAIAGLGVALLFALIRPIVGAGHAGRPCPCRARGGPWLCLSRPLFRDHDSAGVVAQLALRLGRS